MTFLSRRKYPFWELRSWLIKFKRDEYKTIQVLKEKGGHKWLIQKLQQKL